MTNYRLTLCYDGTRYRGWQKQGNTPDTIQGRLESLLSRLLEQPVEIAGSGRTDAGVHARQQVCSFRAENAPEPEMLLEQIRSHLPEDIGAVSLEKADARFHARLSCREKTYVYRLWVSDAPCVFERRYVWKVPPVPDEGALLRAAQLLCGTHDFAAFTSARGKKSTVRTVKEISLEKTENEWRLRFTGDGFLYNMVRILTGTLLEAGRGERTPESVLQALDAGDRSLAGFTAPAQGLTLWQVRY